MRTYFRSWGNVCGGEHETASLSFRDENPFADQHNVTLLPFGTGRSYGDSCINSDNGLIETRRLNRFISFDVDQGILRCEAGVTLGELLRFSVPQGYFIPVSLGTKLITVGGAIANDVHGKNHHRTGTFGCHVRSFELLRSDGTRRTCSLTENADLYRATIGGLGLTGVILSAEIALAKIPSAFLHSEMIRFRNLEEYLALVSESDVSFEHSSAWVDYFSSGGGFGRGVFFRGNFDETSASTKFKLHRSPTAIPFFAPNWLLNRAGMKLFNEFYFRRLRRDQTVSEVHYDAFFFPLDGVDRWNRLYGKRGFFQYQFVVPVVSMISAMTKVESLLRESRVRPFLSVLKSFGSIKSSGTLSFPMEGLTVALDFPNLGAGTRAFFDRLDEIVGSEGGRLYPAKDARMSADRFQAFFPMWREFAQHVDPRLSSDFWRRVTGGADA